MPCLYSAKLFVWESGCLLKTLRCEDWYPYPLIGEQTCHRQAQLWQRQGTDSAIGGSSSCLNRQSLFRIKAAINRAAIHPASHAACSQMGSFKSKEAELIVLKFFFFILNVLTCFSLIDDICCSDGSRLLQLVTKKQHCSGVDLSPAVFLKKNNTQEQYE